MATKSMWDRTEEMARQHDQGSSTWLKLTGDGDKAVVVFLGEPYPREVVFRDGKYVTVTEEMKARGDKASLRVALNVALYDTREVKVLEQGVVFFKQLLQLRSKRSLDQWTFEVERHGAAGDKQTSYSILPEQKLTAEEQAEFQALPLHDLERLYSNDGGSELDSYDRKASATVDPKAAQAIVQSLKSLPREAVDQFCQRFGVSRIKDLPAARAEEAETFVAALEAELSGRSAAATDIDPFAD